MILAAAVKPRSKIWQYVSDNFDSIVGLAWGHIWVVGLSIAIAAVIGVGLGVLTYKTRVAATVVLTIASLLLTIPAFALLGLLLAVLGLGVVPVVISLVLYALLPIVRNTITGLRSLDEKLLDSARGLGMSPVQRLWRVELPVAWPVILAGLRVATQLVIGIAAIAAYVNGPGLGKLLFFGFNQLGGANAKNEVVVGLVGIIIIALAYDAILALIGRLTISKGIRA